MAASKRFSFTVGRAGPALESRVADLRVRLDLVPPVLLAERTGASYLELGQGRDEFHFIFINAPLVLTYPNFQALTVGDELLPVIKQALLLYYFFTSNGSPPSGKLISFADLPDGRVYSSAFQANTGDAIVKRFGLNIRSFQASCESFGGEKLTLGDLSYRFHVLPKLDLFVVFHLGDDEFPSACKILFDESAEHYLPTEGCAILGSMFVQQLLRTNPPGA